VFSRRWESPISTMWSQIFRAMQSNCTLDYCSMASLVRAPRTAARRNELIRRVACKCILYLEDFVVILVGV
jgi:hypothetical protein